VQVVAAAEKALVRVELLSVNAVVEPSASSKARMYARATVATGKTKIELRAVSRRSYIQPEYDLGAYDVGVRIADLVRDWIRIGNGSWVSSSKCPIGTRLSARFCPLSQVYCCLLNLRW
jgi:hypothetical protein